MSSTTGLRGRWAQGLQPRYFTWVIMDRLGAGERPGGFARNHRKVRRQEELIWLSVHGFTHIVSLLDSPHNLHAYDEAGLASVHVPLGRTTSSCRGSSVIYGTIAKLLDDPAEKLFVHHEEFGDRLLGVLAGYLVYAGLVDEGTARDLGDREAHRPQPRLRRPRDGRRHPRRAPRTG